MPEEQAEPEVRVVERVIERVVEVPVDPWPREPPVRRDSIAKYDRLGRKQPGRLTPMHFFRAYPPLMRAFKKRVPVERVERRTEGGQRFATFTCVCEFGHEVTPNSAVRCRCGRWFFDTGRDVLVAREPEEETPVVD